MKTLTDNLIFLCLLLCTSICADDKPKTVSFNSESYFHRWSTKTLHEFTPKGQEDLKKWTDMVSLIPYNIVKNEDDLAIIAQNLFNAYQQIKNVPIKFYHLPKESKKPKEHVIIILLIAPEYIECVFTRLKLHENQGLAIVYSHKVYGKKAGDETSKWLKENGEKIEKELLNFNDLPNIAELNKLSAKDGK